MNKLLISASNVAKKFKSDSQDVQVLKGVDMNVYAGEFVAIVGASGAGKSTLLYCLCGLYQADSGQINLCGTDIAKMSPGASAKIRRDRMSFIFQDLNLINSLNVYDNVRLPAKMAGIKLSKGDISSALEHVGLAGTENKYPHQLSGGQRQRVAIARSIVRRPELMFADEPTGSLDVNTGRQIMKLLKGITSYGSSLVMVTHDLDIAAAADRVIVLNNGRTGAVLVKPTVEQIFAAMHGVPASGAVSGKASAQGRASVPGQTVYPSVPSAVPPVPRV